MTRVRTHLSTATAPPAVQRAVPGGAGLRAQHHRNRSRHAHRYFWAQAALVWLLLALVVVPSLGRLHQVLHAEALPGVRGSLAVGVVQKAQATQPAQGLGLPLQGSAPALRTAHSGDASVAQPAESQQQQQQHPGSDHAHSVLHLLLPHHTPVDCLLLDQLALGDALYSAPTALTGPAPAQAPVAYRAASAAARHIAFFQARGPPAAG